MKEHELEQRLAEGADELRRSIENDGMQVDEERRKSRRLLLKCSKEGKILLASISLDRLGWRLAIVSENGIGVQSKMAVQDTSLKALHKLIEQAGLKIVAQAEVQFVSRQIEGMLEEALNMDQPKNFESDPRKMTVKDLMRKWNRGN